MHYRKSIHRAEVRRVAEELSERGLEVTFPARDLGYDLLVNGRRVSVKVSRPGLQRHTVYAAGRRYVYHYTTWRFNFQRHNRWPLNYFDVVVCVADRRPTAGRRERYIIPRPVVAGPTFCVYGGKAYSGQYARYLENWTALLSP